MLIVKEEIKDIGNVVFGRPVTFEIEVHNTLEKDMIVNKVQVSCASCTTATMPKKVRGKESVNMKVTYKPGVLGNIAKWVDIVYDNDQLLRVKFKGVVINE